MFKSLISLLNKPKKCPKCSEIAWKCGFYPFVQKGKEGIIETRICGNCGYKPTKYRFIKGKRENKREENHNI